MTDKLAGVSRLYIDTNILIYAVQGHEVYGDLAESLFRQISSLDIQVVLSDLTRCECLIGAYKSKQPELIYIFEEVFATNSASFEMSKLSESDLVNVPTLADGCGLKTLDAIHLSLALNSRCDGFATEDKDFKGIQGLLRLVTLT